MLTAAEQTALHQLRGRWQEFYAVYCYDQIWSARVLAAPWHVLTADTAAELSVSISADHAARQDEQRR